jgi:1,2-diacylglycerol 3-alpha-glucosyltransferase
MNIGIFTDTYTPQVNGVVSSILTLEKQLIAQNHQVYVFTTTHPDAPSEDAHVFRLPSIPFVFLAEHRVGILYSPKVVKKIKKLKLDVILSQTEFSLGLFAKLVSKQLRIPIVHTYHTMYEQYMHYISKGIDFSPKLARRYSRMFCNGVDGVVAPTEKTKRLLEKYEVEAPIRVIPTGIDFSPFYAENYSVEDTLALKASLEIPQDIPIILFVGRVAKEKSIDMILESLAQLKRSRSDFCFVVVGDGPERANLEQRVHQLQLNEHVRFIGMQPWQMIGKFYQLGDLFVSASMSETQGLTFAEALAASLPVLARRDESVEGLISDGYNGNLFDTAEELSTLLQQLLDNPTLAEIYKRNALSSIAPLSAEIFGQNALAYYQDIIALYQAEHASQKKLLQLPNWTKKNDNK